MTLRSLFTVKMPLEEVNGRDEATGQALQGALSFYGLQLQSHAATVTGFALGMFAVLQVWILFTNTNAPRPPSMLQLLFFVPVLGVLITLAWYSFMRLVLYGSLSKALMYGSYSQYVASMKNWEKMRDQKHPGYEKDWDDLFPQFKVSVFASYYFHTAKPRPFLYRLYGLTLHVRWPFVLIVLCLSIWFSYLLMSGTFDWLSSIVACIILGYASLYWVKHPNKLDKVLAS